MQGGISKAGGFFSGTVPSLRQPAGPCTKPAFRLHARCQGCPLGFLHVLGRNREVRRSGSRRAFRTTDRPSPTSRMRRRSEITTGLEVYVLLPTDSVARASLLAHVERQVQDMIRLEADEVRNWSHVAGGAYFIVAGSALSLWFQSWWLALIVAPFVGLGLAMGADGAVRARRDDQGFRADAFDKRRSEPEVKDEGLERDRRDRLGAPGRVGRGSALMLPSPPAPGSRS